MITDETKMEFLKGLSKAELKKVYNQVTNNKDVYLNKQDWIERYTIDMEQFAKMMNNEIAIRYFNNSEI